MHARHITQNRSKPYAGYFKHMCGVSAGAMGSASPCVPFPHDNGITSTPKLFKTYRENDIFIEYIVRRVATAVLLGTIYMWRWGRWGGDHYGPRSGCACKAMAFSHGHKIVSLDSCHSRNCRLHIYCTSLKSGKKLTF